MYEMLCGLPPWYSEEKAKTIEGLRKKPVSFPKKINVSTLAKSFIEELLRKNPHERLGDSDIKSHRFFESINWKALLCLDVSPPFNPCRFQDAENSTNFDNQFTSVDITSLTALYEKDEKLTSVENIFQRFTFDLCDVPHK